MGTRLLWIGFKDAFLSLMTPVIIVGGILFGVFTPVLLPIAVQVGVDPVHFGSSWCLT